MLTPLPTTNIPGVWGSLISKQSAQEGGMVVSATLTSLLEVFLVLIYVKG
jgi:hypothetical protein